MTKYKQYYNRMVDQNKELFDGFQKIHDAYTLNPDDLQEKFNESGKPVLEVMREWESKLCMQSEKGGYSRFTAGLAEKFQGEVRKHFPEIDSVGLIIQSGNGEAKDFAIKKINL